MIDPVDVPDWVQGLSLLLFFVHDASVTHLNNHNRHFARESQAGRDGRKRWKRSC